MRTSDGNFTDAYTRHSTEFTEYSYWSRMLYWYFISTKFVLPKDKKSMQLNDKHETKCRFKHSLRFTLLNMQMMHSLMPNYVHSVDILPYFHGC